MQFPLQKLMELNMKTIQGFSYLKPGEVFAMKKPEELLERNMNMFIQNGHMALNYMRDVFNILEDHWLNVSHRTQEMATEAVKQTMPAVNETMMKMDKNAGASEKSMAKGPKENMKNVGKTEAKPNMSPVASSTNQMMNAAENKMKQQDMQGKEAAHNLSSNVENPNNKGKKLL